jgi:hypothetical protein
MNQLVRQYYLLGVKDKTIEEWWDFNYTNTLFEYIGNTGENTTATASSKEKVTED